MDEALEVVGNWRAIHAFPLNTFQMRLRSAAADVYPNSLVAQRLKRLSSIEFKLRRFPNMQLPRMQDIGGCRVVLRSPAEVRRLAQDYRSSRIKHHLVGEKDYITTPKESGYRGIHLIYRYHSDRMTTYNGLLIELQIRTLLQHAWATAVETVGIFLEHSLKSSMGPNEWLRFFALSASAFARVERSPLVPGTPTTARELIREIGRLKGELNVEQQLRTFGQALRVTERASRREAHFFLLALTPGNLTIYSYRKDELSRATTEYLRIEKDNERVSGAQAVLVAAESLKALRRAYPNFYLDTERFLLGLRRATYPVGRSLEGRRPSRA
jgi:hypothetical protein